MLVVGSVGCGQGGTERTAAGNVQSGKAQLRERCIGQAKSQGYRNGQCAYSFIKACIETQSRTEMESVLRSDSMLGIGSSLSCPNMSDEYSADFDKF